MRYFILFLFSFSVSAAPFVVSDPTTNTAVIGCSSSLDGAAFIDSPLVSGACRIDVQPTDKIANGTHAMAVRFYSNDEAWGRRESAITNFTFTKPGLDERPAGLVLKP